LTDTTPVTLESTRSNGNKVRVRLVLQNTEEYSIFPGQVVALEGKNPTGKLLLVSKLYEGCRLPFYSNITPKSVTHNTSVVIGSGPWHEGLSSLTYNTSSIFRNLLREVKKNLPDLIILIGPFVDANHKLVNNGNIEKTFDQLFESSLQQIKQEIGTNSQTKIIIIPSLNDAHHDDVFPQPPFKADNNNNQPFTFFPNPCIMKIDSGEVTVGVTSVDIIKHLAGEETSNKSKLNSTTDRKQKLCQHLINQRSFYPLFPPDTTANIDTSKYHQLKFPYTPDILIVPSDLPHFIKNVDGVLCINPGRANKGTFARFTINNDPQLPKKIVERTRVDIIRM